MDQNHLHTILLAGVLGGAAASLLGREKTRVANFAVGCLFTGVVAYYDPAGSPMMTVLMSGLEGAAWGAYDRFVPALKERLLAPHEGAA
jgi:hypothetical protein